MIIKILPEAKFCLLLEYAFNCNYFLLKKFENSDRYDPFVIITNIWISFEKKKKSGYIYLLHLDYSDIYVVW